jgi:virulence factor Mce-like protein
MPRGPRVNPVLVGLLAAGGMVVALVVAFANINPFAHTISLRAQVTSGDTLVPGADVDVAGVKIGSVKSVEKGDAGAVVTMTMDSRSVSVYKDATAYIRPHGVFGPKFIEITPGTESAGRMADGGTIDISHTKISVDFDQLLNELDPNTRMSLRTVFYELGTGSQGRGADVGAIIDNLGTVETQLTPVLNRIDARSPELGRFMENNATVNETLAASPLDQIIRSNADVLARLDERRPDVAGVIVHGDNVFTALDVITNGNVEALRGSLQKLPSLLTKLNQFNDQVGFGASSLNPVAVPQHGQAVSDIGLAIARTKDAFGECDVSNSANVDTVHATNITIVPCLGPDGKRYVDKSGHVAHHHVKVLLGLHTGLPNQDEEGSVLCGPNTKDQAKHTAYSCQNTIQSDAPGPVSGYPQDGSLGGTLTAPASSTSGARLWFSSPEDVLSPQTNLSFGELLGDY